MRPASWSSRGGAIVEVGGPDVPTPQGAVEHDLTGRVLLPGLVDSHSHVGAASGGDGSSPLHPDVRGLDSIDILSDGFWRARAGGITTVNVMPGSGHLMSGQTVYLKLRDGGRTVEDWLFCDDPLAGVCGGMKMANGTNSMRNPPFPGTRARSAALVRGLYYEARAYVERRRAEDEPPGRARTAHGGTGGGARRRPHRPATTRHRHNDIATVLRLRDEFGFRVVIQHGTEAWKLADEIAAAGVPVSITFIDAPGGKGGDARLVVGDRRHPGARGCGRRLQHGRFHYGFPAAAAGRGAGRCATACRAARRWRR